MVIKDTEGDRELYELMYKIRETMQAVQLQYDVMKHAIDMCGKIDRRVEYIECIGAVNVAHKEILRFLELNVKLARLIDELSLVLKNRGNKRLNV